MLSKLSPWECIEKIDAIRQECGERRDFGYEECAKRRDDGDYACREWAKKFECCDWWPCSLFCDALVWLGKLICLAWTWISSWVCVAYRWVENWLCVLWVWVTYSVCVAYQLACWFQAQLATNERSFHAKECIFGWDAGYRIEDRIEEEGTCELKITMRIRLNPDDDVTQEQVQERANIWKTGIEKIWSGQYLIERTDGECICEIYNVIVEVLWVDSNEHHTVDVRVGPDTSNSNLWDTADDEYTAAHEFGHLLGLVDEYYDSRCPHRDLSDDNSIMENDWKGYDVKARHYEPFARWVSLRTCCKYDVKT